MATSCRSWWRNCALEADSEILAIDKMENHISPIGPDVKSIRELISSLELCHHKAERWVRNIIEAIGAGETRKGLGTRSPGQQHPTEKVWQNACAALSAWCAGCPVTSVNLIIDNVPASRMLACLGERSLLKEWQVQRVMEKIRSSIHWPQPLDDPAAQYVWLLLSGGEYESAYRSQCPEHYKEHEEFWLKTVRTIIHDTENGDEAELSLGLAIDMLMPCHWNFLENLQVLLEAIGGKLNPQTPFAACGRNIILLPIRRRMEIVSNTLKIFYSTPESNREMDRDLLALLGEPTEVKKWMAASLDKTIRLQLSPPAELRAISALAGPDWIKK
ncbi:MAG: hypothetical protein PVH61_16035 [Candidatus Aminicenantes bacterium]|jgi:hypothetical protein